MMQNALHDVHRASTVSSWILTLNITSFHMSPLTALEGFTPFHPLSNNFQKLPCVLFMYVYFLIRINLSESNRIVS